MKKSRSQLTPGWIVLSIFFICFICMNTVYLFAQPDAGLQVQYTFKNVTPDGSQVLDESGNYPAVMVNGATVQKKGDPSSAGDDYKNRALPGDVSLTPDGGAVWFNALGEPIDNAGVPLSTSVVFTVGSGTLTVCPQTGYVNEGNNCP